MDQKHWSREEISQLKELYGVKTIPQLAVIFERSIKNVQWKIWDIGLGSFKTNSEFLSAKDVADMLHISTWVVRYDWPRKYGFRYQYKKPMRQRRFRYITHHDLMTWLEKNQDKWDSRNVEEYGLGIEPEWLKEKRRRDKMVGKKKSRYYTPEDDKIMISMYKQGYSDQDIADRVDRTVTSVQRRISHLDVWGTGRYIPEKELKDAREEQARKEAYIRLMNVLQARKNQLDFDGYWQKEMCVHWNDVRGCTAGENDCDSCISFQRIQPQYCKRCGATFLEREPERFCSKCREQRKKQYQKKWMILNSTLSRK